MTIETEVANLTTQTTALLNAVNVSKATLDQKATVATEQAAIATAKASDATTSASQSAGSAAQALAIFGTSAAMQAKLDTAAAQANAAAASAASAGSVLQQDLSMASNAPLHRSPNAIVAQCIYDTSLDSDGGAWVDRMSHTSWMNEPLNGAWRGQCASEAAARAISGAATGDYYQLTTDGKFYKLKAGSGVTEVFRGNKAKFPRLAAIVAEGTSVTIYDLTEAGRPMWMRFTYNQVSWARDNIITGGGGDPIGSIAAMNGVVAIGCSIQDGGVTQIMFSTDKALKQIANTHYGGYYNSNIANRNTSKGYRGGFEHGMGGIVNSIVNAVAMTVLPDAPIDPATGLQIPTIAVGTAGGVSVIRHDGTVLNSAWTDPCTAVGFDKKYGLISSTANNNWPWTYTKREGYATGSTPFPAVYFLIYYGGLAPHVISRGTSRFLAANGGVTASNTGITLIKANPANYINAAVAYAANTFGTGHMVGDTRRCYLANTEVESIGPAPELVTNGTFDTDTAGWTPVSGAVSWASGRMRITNNTGTDGPARAYQAVSTVIGKAYRVVANLYVGTSFASIGITAGNGAGFSSIANSITQSSDRQHTVAFTATQTTTYIYGSGAIPDTLYYEMDNISVKEVIPDRSYKASGANILGTLTKSAVATAAQLVAYSGFSASNYLQEPYSADLDFGTGEWSVGAWVNTLYGNSSANLMAAPENLSSTSYLKSGVTISPDTAVAPNGTTTMDKVVDSVDSTQHYVTCNYVSQGFSGVTVSLYMKAAEWTNGFIYLDRDASGNSIAWSVDLVTGVATPTRTPGDAWVSNSGSINVTPAANDCFKITVSGSLLSADSVGLRFGSDPKVTYDQYGIPANYTGDGVKGIYVWGIKSNSGLVTSDYIPGKTAVYNPVAPIADRRAATGPSIELGIDGYGKLVATAYDGTTTRTVTTANAYSTGTWLKARATYVAGKLGITVNGVEVATAVGAPLLTLNNSDAVLTIGNSRTLDAPFPGSIALLKLGATVPTPEQALWMYEQEKQMFRDGAQITLPSSAAVSDLAYDESRDRWTALQAGHESSFTGLVRTAVNTPSAGSFAKVAATSGVKLLARTTTSPGVDVTIPAYGLREELVKRSEAAAKASKPVTPFEFDTVSFTATTTSGSNQLTSVASVVGTPYLGMGISGTGIPAGTTIIGINGATYTLSANATAAGTAVAMGQSTFTLPAGYVAKDVLSAGARKREGATKDWVRLFDGFRETVRFAVSPGSAAWVQINAAKE